MRTGPAPLRRGGGVHKPKAKAKARAQAALRPASRPATPRPGSGSKGAKPEIELQFQVPPAAWEPLAQAMQGPDAHELDLQAIYFDSPEGALAAARVSLRLRREGDRWIQTAKSAGAGPMERREASEVAGLAVGPAPPALDPGRHDPATQALLRKALGLDASDDWPALAPVFQVEVRRRVRRLVEGDSVIELALDEGMLRAAGRRREIRELELELLEGRFEDLLRLARRWRERHGLWIGSASKAQRGWRLARGELYGPAVGAKAIDYPADVRLRPLSAAVLQACLEQILANAGEIGAGSQADDHIHQLRVGLRRLRTALRELPGLKEPAQAVEGALVHVFRQLGERRDRTHVLAQVQPRVEAAGGPALRVPPGFHEGGTPPDQLVQQGAFQAALLRLLAEVERLRAGPPGKRARKQLRPILDKLAHQVTRDGRRFTRLSPEDQHRVRKRLKRLRYMTEFAAPLYAGQRVAGYLEVVKPAQEALGQYNDEIMAHDLYAELADTDAGARFGVDWLASRRKGEARTCRQVLRQLDDTRPYWSRRG
ncbi:MULTISPECIES: CHAD domain-containing protein [Ramlibacter]|uniref:CHAD domain-containing protein n=1 Tax=Ramlibacter pinisoli TaxID=2682844 RepID=A0A6N8IQ21_9BURK|nr:MULTISPECIES: CHAD domain-containing protein [Ramlibacter]MBA2964023.1 CHAD domain-containing protein [Ramlibacter sp. CGMCC 1.13660]MVQ28989.1 CHAD domain-containing protein [Ramlibacter pinisoli]